MSNPKILFVTPLPPPVHGSAMVSQYIKNSELLKKEFDMDFVNLSTSRSMAEIGKKSYFLYIRKLGRFLGSYFMVLWKLLTCRYDLCYLAITCNGVGFLKDMPFVLLCKMFGRKVVIHQHNKGMAGFADKPVYKQLLNAVYKNAKVILLSWNLYPDIKKIVRKEQVMICPNGIPAIKDEGLGIRGYGDNSVPELLYLSNLVEGKGAYVILDALKILKDKGLKFHCSFVGGESKQITAEIFATALNKRGLENCVDYVGPKYEDDKEEYWQKADVFVFPTFYYNECFPLVLLEAMQHGVAVVSSNEGGISDIVDEGNTGFIVDACILREESCNELLGESASEAERERSRHFNARRGMQTAEALEKLITTPELRQKMGEAGYKRYNELFTLEAFEKKMCECLKECIDA